MMKKLWKKSVPAVFMLVFVLALAAPVKTQAKTTWKKSYQKLVKKLNKKGGKAYRYQLIYFNNDKIPELVVGENDKNANFISMYTFKNGKVYTVMNKWYDEIGEYPYTYLPKQNCMKYYSSQYSGAAIMKSYFKMNSKYKMERMNGTNNIYMAMCFKDLNGNGEPDAGEYLDYYTYYCWNTGTNVTTEITQDAFDSLGKQGTYKSMVPKTTYSKIMKKLK